MTGVLERPSITATASRQWTLFGVVAVAHAIIAVAVGEATWDDGYITLAFARTFAETGHIALTPHSEIVEGATSPAWFLMMSGVYKLGVTSFYGFHLASQVLAGLCAAAAAVLIYRMILPSVPTLAFWISLAAVLLGPVRGETANGMEMTLLCVLVLALVATLRDTASQPLLPAMALAAAVPWVRLEAAGYVIVGAVALAVFSRRTRVAVAIVAGSVLSIAAVSVVRYLVFDTVVLTNTMVAKTVSPYSPPVGTSAWAHQLLQGVILEPLLTVLPAVLLGLLLIRLSERFGLWRSVVSAAKARRLPPRVSFGVAYACAFIGFTVVFGANYFSRPGRMGTSAMLVLLVAVATFIPVVAPVVVPRLRTRLAVASLLVVPFLGVAADDTVWLYLGRFAPDSTATKASTHAFHRNGLAIDEVREMLGRESISALIVDVGAASLCCERVEVLDLGLLANRELSASGWDHFGAYLQSKRPDVIQSHGYFSQESRIYENPYFRANYTPAVVGDSLLYLRNDHYRDLGGGCVPAPLDGAYFYSGFEGFSSRPDASPANVIDSEYVDTLGLDAFCRLDGPR